MYDYKGSVALVTGASWGIGESLARQLAERGIAGLVLVARSEGRLEALAAEIRERYGARVAVIAADLSDPDAPERIRAEVAARDLAVDLLVNNAGFGSYGPFAAQDVRREKEMVAVNITAVVALTHAFLPMLTARGRGAILNVASTAAFQPIPYMATYGATKAFVLSFSEALWAENRERGLRVVCLCPGGTATNFHQGLEGERGRFERLPQHTPDQVARAGLDGLDRDALCVIVGTVNYIGTLLVGLLPRAAVVGISAVLFRPVSAATRGGYRTAGLAALLVGAALAGYAAWRKRG